MRPVLSHEQLVAGVLAGERSVLARAITLVESRRAEDEERAEALLTALMPHTGGARRVGVTGVPGVGKSTFVEALGTRLTAAGRRVAVLAIDPSSTRTGGSILGDKTRMVRLANDPAAFVRPSPTAGALGGVAARTREAMLLCEAAGYDVVLVETVGIGQSELAVASMTDVFLVLMLAGAGDELQGIKRGLMELADIVAVNKADGPNRAPAERAAAAYASALHTLHPPDAPWQPRVVTCSALEASGVAEVWELIEAHRATMMAAGLLRERRQAQQVDWMWSTLDERLRARVRQHPEVRASLPGLEREVREGRVPSTAAARRLLRIVLGG